MKEGQVLYNAIRLSKYKVDEVLKKTGFSSGTLYNLYDADIIEDFYKEQLKKLKLNLDFSTKNTINSVSEPMPEYRKKTNDNMTDEMIKEIIDANKKYREHLDRQMTIIENLTIGHQSKAS